MVPTEARVAARVRLGISPDYRTSLRYPTASLGPPGLNSGGAQILVGFLPCLVIGSTKLVPVSIMNSGHIPSGEQVFIPRNDTVKGSGSGDQLLAGGGASDAADQIIDRGVLNAGNIDRIALVGEP